MTNEFNSLEKNYGPYIAVEIKDERRRLCVLRCTYSPDNASSFRVYLILSRHYPVISQLFVRCKALTAHNDEQFRTFQGRIQETLEETSAHCFYHGQLCLHKCLTKLEQLFDTHYKQEKLLYIAATAANSATKRRDPSFTNSEIESLSGLSSANSQPAGQGNNQNGNRFFGVSSSSTRTSDSQLSTMSLAQGAWRTCGARFAGGTHLICFGRAATNQQSSGAAILTALNDGTMNRPQSLPLRSTSLNLSKSRENSTSIEQSNYRSTTTMTSNVPIQSSSNNPRLPMFSAPVRSTMSSSVFNEHQRLSSYRRSLGHLIHPLSIVAIYDVFILLPVSRKLADDYRIDLNNPIDMCEVNEQKTQEMGKSDLARCWRLLGGLLSIQPTLQPNDVWFHTPIAHGNRAPCEKNSRTYVSPSCRPDQTSRFHVCRRRRHPVGQHVPAHHVAESVPEDDHPLAARQRAQPRSCAVRVRQSAPSLEVLLQAHADPLADRPQLPVAGAV